MKSSIPIGVQPNTRVLRIERNRADEVKAIGAWCVWISMSADLSNGTYIKLYDNGRIERVTLDPAGFEEVTEIKPEDRHD